MAVFSFRAAAVDYLAKNVSLSTQRRMKLGDHSAVLGLLQVETGQAYWGLPGTSLSSALSHTPPCSIKSGLCGPAMTSAHRLTVSLKTDTLRAWQGSVGSGTKLLIQLSTTRRLCTLFYLSEKPVETSEHPGIDGRLGPGLLFVTCAVRRTFRAINNTLTLLFIVVNKPISFEWLLFTFLFDIIIVVVTWLWVMWFMLFFDSICISFLC